MRYECCCFLYFFYRSMLWFWLLDRWSIKEGVPQSQAAVDLHTLLVGMYWNNQNNVDSSNDEHIQQCCLRTGIFPISSSNEVIMPNQSGIAKEKQQRCMEQSQNGRANLKENGQIQSETINTCFESNKKCFAERFAKTNTGPWKNLALINRCFSAKLSFIFQKFNYL